MNRTISVVVSVILLALLLGACARATPTPRATPAPTLATTPVPTPASAATPTRAVTTPAPTPTPAPKPKPEGLIRLGRSSWGGEVFDPYIAPATISNQVSLIYDALVGATPDRENISADTGLAYKWEQSPDGLSWTFYLRKGVMFDRGYGEATAEDVKFSLERVTREGSRGSGAGTLRARLKRIEVVDPYTVRLFLNAPAVTLPFDLSLIMALEGTIQPKKYIEKVGEKEFAASPIGTGPYRLVKNEPGLYMKLEAREDYWAGVPKFKELYLFNIPEEATRVAMLKTGELDIAEVSVPRLQELKAAGFQIFEKAGTNQLTLYIDHQWGPAHSDVRVRQALNLAVNKKEMADNLFGGRASLLPGTLFTWALGFKRFEAYPYDPGRAKELLADAGYPKGYALQMTAPLKEPLPITNQAVAGYMEAIGIKTKIVPMEDSAYMNELQKGVLTNTTNASYVVNRLFTVSFWRAKTHSKGMVTDIRDPKLDALIEAAEKAKDLDELATYHGKLQQYGYENYLFAPLLEVGDFYAVSPKLALQTWGVGKKSRYEIGLTELVTRR